MKSVLGGIGRVAQGVGGVAKGVGGVVFGEAKAALTGKGLGCWVSLPG